MLKCQMHLLMLCHALPVQNVNAMAPVEVENSELHDSLTVRYPRCAACQLRRYVPAPVHHRRHNRTAVARGRPGSEKKRPAALRSVPKPNACDSGPRAHMHIRDSIPSGTRVACTATEHPTDDPTCISRRSEPLAKRAGRMPAQSISLSISGRRACRTGGRVGRRQPAPPPPANPGCRLTVVGVRCGVQGSRQSASDMSPTELKSRKRVG